MSTTETDQQRGARNRGGRIAVILSFAFWIFSAGGIILMINLNK